MGTFNPDQSLSHLQSTRPGQHYRAQLDRLAFYWRTHVSEKNSLVRVILESTRILIASICHSQTISAVYISESCKFASSHSTCHLHTHELLRGLRSELAVPQSIAGGNTYQKRRALRASLSPVKLPVLSDVLHLGRLRVEISNPTYRFANG